LAAFTARAGNRRFRRLSACAPIQKRHTKQIHYGEQ
jgi:hypothetical protein